MRRRLHTKRLFSSRRDKEQGSVLLEAVIITPLLLMLILGVFDLGMGWRASLTVTSSARSGARVASNLGRNIQTDPETIRAVAAGLHNNDVTAKQLGGWVREYESGVFWIRKLVRAFYSKDFSFGGFMKEFPHHGKNLTDLLVGRVFEGNPGRIFEDLDPWMEKMRNSEAIEC